MVGWWCVSKTGRWGFAFVMRKQPIVPKTLLGNKSTKYIPNKYGSWSLRPHFIKFVDSGFGLALKRTMYSVYAYRWTQSRFILFVHEDERNHDHIAHQSRDRVLNCKPWIMHHAFQPKQWRTLPDEITNSLASSGLRWSSGKAESWGGKPLMKR